MSSDINLRNYTTEEIKNALRTVERMAAYQKQYYAGNRETLLEKEKAYRKTHPENEKQIPSKER